MREMIDILRRGDERESPAELLFGLACCLGTAVCMIGLLWIAAEWAIR